MVVEFTTNIVNSSNLGCLMFFRKRFLKIKHANKWKILLSFLQQKNYILGNKSFFLTGWNCLEINIGVKYVGERKKNLGTLFFLPNFHQLNLEQCTIHGLILANCGLMVRTTWQMLCLCQENVFPKFQNFWKEIGPAQRVFSL